MNLMKRFVCAVLAVSLVLLASLAALVVLVDPFFQFHTPGDAEVFENERYENPGMIRNLEYDTVLMGTSLVCNYRASWFDELTGGQTIKIAYRDGYLSDFDTALSLAFRTHPDIRAVYFGLDANILVRSDAERTVDLPGWLYDDNPLNDVQYFLNKDVYLECLNVLWQRRQGNTRALDDAYVWDGDYIFSGAQRDPAPRRRLLRGGGRKSGGGRPLGHGAPRRGIYDLFLPLLHPVLGPDHPGGKAGGHALRAGLRRAKAAGI